MNKFREASGAIGNRDVQRGAGPASDLGPGRLAIPIPRVDDAQRALEMRLAVSAALRYLAAHPTAVVTIAAHQARKGQEIAH